MKPLINLVAAFVAASLSSVQAQTDLRDQLRGSISSVMDSQEGEQSLTIGPMEDGRTLLVTVRDHRKNSPSSITALDQGPNIFEVAASRLDLLRVPFGADAMMGCFKNPSLCDHMSDYLDHLSEQSHPSNMLFFDEIFPETEETFANLRSQPFWAVSIRMALQSASQFIQFHEICHAVLGHLEEPVPNQERLMQEESEADGCAGSVLERFGDTQIGALTAGMNTLFLQLEEGQFSSTHPPAVCRSLARTESASRWLSENTELFEEELADIPKPDFDIIQNGIQQFMLERQSECGSYLLSYARGYAVANRLITNETPIEVDEPIR
ncbi:hypothetical protein P5P81_21190 [Tritonibacter mobilis]|nr:hypothetical protein [Tritonibacter mobilis]